MDRASGSGVFARDPDALIDLVELEVSEELLTQRLNQAACEVYKQALQERNNAYYQQNVGLDDLLSPAQMRTHFEKGIPDVMARAPYVDRLEEVRNKVQIATAWRVEGTLREFAKFKPVCGSVIQYTHLMKQACLRILSWTMINRAGKELKKLAKRMRRKIKSKS